MTSKRRSMSIMTGMFWTRLTISPPLGATSIKRSKNGRGRMCGKTSILSMWISRVADYQHSGVTRRPTTTHVKSNARRTAGGRHLHACESGALGAPASVQHAASPSKPNP